MTPSAEGKGVDAVSSVNVPSAARVGRAPSTTVDELAHISLGLFFEHGFDETTVDDIAAAAGIGRRTLFRYFSSKNDLPWGDFDGLVDSMRATLRAVPDDVPMMQGLQAAVLQFNRFPAAETRYHRERMALILRVPTLIAHSSLRYRTWREAVAEYAGRRLGLPPDALQPQTIAWVLLAVSLAAYEQWLANDDADLQQMLRTAFASMTDIAHGG